MPYLPPSTHKPMALALIFGCARSGTSILGEVFAASDEVSYIFEAHRVWERAGLGENDSHRLIDRHARPEITAWYKVGCPARRPSVD